MNNKGQVALVGLMVGIMIFMLAMIFIDPIGDVIDEALVQDREKRIVSIGQCVKAMVLNGLGFINKQ